MDKDKPSSVSGTRTTSPVGPGRRRMAFAVALLTIIAGIVLYCFRSSEPVYRGTRLSDWLERSESADASERNEAIKAVRAVGTNAIPWLLAELELQLPRWKHRLNQWLSQQNLVTFRFDTDEFFVRQERTLAGFEALGSDARCAIPALAKLNRKNPNAPGPLRALAYCGSEAIPFLWYSLTNDQSRIAPGQAALAIKDAVDLGKISISNALVFVPTLTRLLESSSPYITNKAGLALESILQKPAGSLMNSNQHTLH